ncbi:hypothetical protein FRC12_022504 [Ceratobasidium sp. 428]|nr:hypothetical protein FRC12_022504 [Ceratobasidium sp. 428]
MRLSDRGYRIPCSTEDKIPEVVFEIETEFRDEHGDPVYVASALFGKSVHPCKCVPSSGAPCRIPWGGEEHVHHGRYDVLPITDDMEWVPASGGVNPDGRMPVEGGHEGGGRLYHAYAEIDGIKIPGKSGRHLGGANIGHDRREIIVRNSYFVLCWKQVKG